MHRLHSHLAIADAVIHHAQSDDQLLTVSDPADAHGHKKGNVFVSMPLNLQHDLPGSLVLPGQVKELISGATADERILCGDSMGTYDNPCMMVEDSHVCLRVMHGSANTHALSLTQLATHSFAQDAVRAEYQKHLWQVVRPILMSPPREGLWIVEDCLASGDTLVGYLVYAASRVQLSRIVRIDVAVATVQGVMLLRETAHQLGLQLELNVGYLAYGLSRGVTASHARLHANYIVYPPSALSSFHHTAQMYIRACAAADGMMYVVGDMGDASKPVSVSADLPWNNDRVKESLGHRGDVHDSRMYIVYFASGGYLMRAYVRTVHPDLRGYETVLSAKRIWSDEARYGYGVLFRW